MTDQIPVTQRRAALSTLFQMIANVPGDIVELGVASGATLREWQRLVELDGTNRLVFGFDSFSGFPALSPEDGPEMIGIGKRVGGETELRPRPLRADEINHGLARLIVGDICDTLPKMAQHLYPALVFCDADLYAPTKVALDLLWPRLPKGGLMIFDEYGHEAWPGETKAVDDFLVANPRLTLNRLDMPFGPSAYLVKP